jgi:glutathione synthase/RimK-type ligase-like ATP-grasp enzyme
MAILSQNDEQTKIDFRHYNAQKPNRNVPYLLPEEISIKIDRLMKKLRLKTGSVDMIVTGADEFFFLEVNPVGQFLNVSHTCNYNLEKKVAAYLAS